MDETKVQIGDDVLLDIGTHSDWYISAICYDNESVNVELRRKTDRNNKWWVAESQAGYCNECKWFRDKQVCGRCRSRNLYAPKDEPQTDCAWK